MVVQAPLRKFDNINLLRAIAALLVVGYHVIEFSHWTTFPEDGPLATLRIGWIGVDIFFAISGFVITYTALALYREDPSGFTRRYWIRRIARIAPLYYLTTLAWVLFVEEGFFRLPLGTWSWQLVTHFTFTHNFFADTHGSLNSPSWSLALEMQFYLLIAVLIGWIDRTPGWRIWLYFALTALAWRTGVWMLHSSEGFAGMFRLATQLPGTLDEFGAGIFIAKTMLDGKDRAPSPRITWPIAAVVTGWAVETILWAYGSYWDLPAMVVFWRTGLSVFLFCLVAAAISLPQTLASRWLSPIEYLGDISYGTYLWHLFPITFLVVRAGYTGLHALAYVVIATIVMSALSWHFFEKMWIRRAHRSRG
jgi:peptidoglycan/LPS O-acetylase OafA/YrhL